MLVTYLALLALGLALSEVRIQKEDEASRPQAAARKAEGGEGTRSPRPAPPNEAR